MDTIFPEIGIARLGRRDNGVVGMLCPVEKQVILTRRQTDSVGEAVVDEGWNPLFADECAAAENNRCGQGGRSPAPARWDDAPSGRDSTLDACPQ